MSGDEQLVLVLGNKNYSSWSMRAGLAAALSGASYREVVVPLFEPGYKEQLRTRSPSGLVPALTHGELALWDSLAIAEYLAELCPEGRLWPSERGARARARAVSAEMHSGFAGLRGDMPMNIRARKPGVGHSEAALADARRVQEIWSDCLQRSGGPFLFGAPSIADCMYAPVVMRFVTYGVEPDADGATYMDSVRQQPAVAAWIDAALAEPWSIERYD